MRHRDVDRAEEVPSAEVVASQLQGSAGKTDKSSDGFLVHLELSFPRVWVLSFCHHISLNHSFVFAQRRISGVCGPSYLHLTANNPIEPEKLRLSSSLQW